MVAFMATEPAFRPVIQARSCPAQDSSAGPHCIIGALLRRSNPESRKTARRAPASLTRANWWTVQTRANELGFSYALNPHRTLEHQDLTGPVRSARNCVGYAEDILGAWRPPFQPLDVGRHGGSEALQRVNALPMAEVEQLVEVNPHQIRLAHRNHRMSKIRDHELRMQGGGRNPSDVIERQRQKRPVQRICRRLREG